MIVLAGPSGAGKSRLAERLGLPVLRLDDFYKDGGDPTLPRIEAGPRVGHSSQRRRERRFGPIWQGGGAKAGRMARRATPTQPDRGRNVAQQALDRVTHPRAGLVDWDHPDSWLPADAWSTIDALCHDGHAEVPLYDIARDGRHGSRELLLDGAAYFVAEGIFAHEVVRHCRDHGLLAAAYCVRQHPLVTFWRRLTRDLRERRKPPLVLVRRGVALMRAQRRVVDRAVAAGCTPAAPDQARTALAQLLSKARTP